MRWHNGNSPVRILVLNAHPDEGSLCDAVAAAYVDGARAGGHEFTKGHRLAFSWRSVLAMDISLCAKTLRVSTGTALCAVSRQGLIAGTACKISDDD